MLHDLFCGDPLLRAYLEGLGHIGAGILDVDPLGVPDNLTLVLTHCCQPLSGWLGINLLAGTTLPPTFFHVLLPQLARDAAVHHVTGHPHSMQCKVNTVTSFNSTVGVTIKMKK